MIFYLIV